MNKKNISFKEGRLLWFGFHRGISGVLPVRSRRAASIASRSVFEILSKEGVFYKFGIWRMWTQDVYTVNEERFYPEERIVSSVPFDRLKGNCFCHRSIDDGYWGIDYPDRHNRGSAVIFGIQF